MDPLVKSDDAEKKRRMLEAPITGICLSTLKSSTCKTLFDKIPTINGFSRSIEGYDLVALGPLLTPHISNSSGTKTPSRFRSDR